VADYYSQQVITAPVKLTDLMITVLQLRRAEVDNIDDATVLDGIVAGQMLHECTVVFEEGWDHEDPEDLKDWHNPEIEEEDEEEFDRLLAMEQQDFFREVLKINPDQQYIELQSGWSCSKMRLDGFGGSSLHVSRKGWMVVTTTDVTMDEDGQFRCGAEFQPWEDEGEQTEAA
jgi:hypothetical protein